MGDFIITKLDFMLIEFEFEFYFIINWINIIAFCELICKTKRK